MTYFSVQRGTCCRRFRSLMCIVRHVLAATAVLACTAANAEQTLHWPLDTIDHLQPHDVAVTAEPFQGRNSVRVRLLSDLDGGDSNTLAVIADSQFTNGCIEVDVNSRVDPDANFIVRRFARGFVGIAFRVAPDVSRFEALYVRPLNGRDPDPERRAHAVQYFSYPDWSFKRFRDEAPGQYEAGADIGPDEWLHLRIDVQGDRAALSINDAPLPALVVKDLKLGAEAAGGIGLWVDTGTEAHFSNLRVTRETSCSGQASAQHDGNVTRGAIAALDGAVDERPPAFR